MNEFFDFCKHNGIWRELSAPYTQEQNGILERKNRTLTKRVKSMLKAKDLLRHFCVEVVSTTTFLVNKSPTKVVEGQTLEEA